MNQIAKRYLQDAKIRYESTPDIMDGWAITHVVDTAGIQQIKDEVVDPVPLIDMFTDRARKATNIAVINHWREIQNAAHPEYDQIAMIQQLNTLIESGSKIKVTDCCIRPTVAGEYNAGSVSFPGMKLHMEYIPGLWSYDGKRLKRSAGCVAITAAPDLIADLLDLIPEVLSWKTTRVDAETLIIPDPENKWKRIISSLDFDS